MSPRGTGAWLAVARLQWKRLLAGTRSRVAFALVVAVSLGVVATEHLRDAAPNKAPNADLPPLDAPGSVVLSLLAYVIPFMFATGLIAEEVSGRTLAFLLVRPLGRLRVGLAKYAAAFLLTALLVGFAAVATGIGALTAEEGALTEGFLPLTRFVATAVVLVGFYTAVCFFWSAAVPEHAGMASAIHFAVLEFGFGHAPGFLRLISMNHSAKVLAGVAGTIPEGVPALDPALHALLLGASLGLALVFALLALGAKEYRMGTSG